MRNQLAMIRYHSATRPRTPWTRAVDVALAGSLVLAPIVAWMCDRIPLRATLDAELYGRVGIHMDRSQYEAWIVPEERAGESWPASPTPYGEFWLTQTTVKRGVPLPTSIVHNRPKIRLEPFSREEPAVNGEIPGDSPLGLAIEQGLRKAKHDELADTWRDPQPPLQRRWISLAVNAAMWWIALCFISWASINIAQFFWHIGSSSRLKRELNRESRGLCIHCGYDLRGLEFNERCPECGGLV